MAQWQIFIKKILSKNDLFLIAAIWFISRILIWTTILLMATKNSGWETGIVSSLNWGIFEAWDSVHYRIIATTGYEFVDDGKEHNLAFFPLFPLTIKILMNLGLSFEASGLLINNFAFLGAICFLYFWLKDYYGIKVAIWAVFVLSFYPSAMFTGVIYTEGLYLFLSTAALWAFECQDYRWTVFWGALATATRPTGIALVPALAIAAWKERRPPIAYFASLASATGILLFSLYCAIYFHNPLAFIAAQRGWRPSLGFDWQGWLNMLMQIVVGDNWKFGWVQNPNGGLQDPWHPLLFGVVVGGIFLIWRNQKSVHSMNRIYGFYALIAFLLIIAEEAFINNLLNALMLLGGGFVLWHLRTKLSPVAVTYGFCGIALLLASGGTISLSRIAYGIVPLSIAIGVLLSRHPRQGYLMLGLFAMLLVKLAVGFAQEQWVG
jgi:Gpi18-like mannosyltransferase